MTTGIYIIVLAIGWSITSPMVMKWSLRHQILTSYTEKEKTKMFGHYKLVIEPYELIEKSPGGKHKMLWKDLLRVEYVDKYVSFLGIILCFIVVFMTGFNQGFC